MRRLDETQPYVNKPFYQQLAHFLSCVVDDSVYPNGELNRLVQEVNSYLKDHNIVGVLTLAQLKGASTQSGAALEVPIAEVLLQVLQPKIGLYGDSYTHALEAATTALEGGALYDPDKEEEQNRRLYAAAKAREIKDKEHAEENEENRRKYNPNNDTSKLSFVEMIEASYEKGEDFITFLFHQVFPTWDNMSQVAFCEHIAQLNKDKEDVPKATLTDTVLSNWHSGRNKPLRESVKVICSAFDIAPDKGETMAAHEIMLWKMIGGHDFQWTGLTGDEALQMAIAETKETNDTSRLVKELVQASGIRHERLQEVLGVQQLIQWQHGAKIQNVDMALKFLSLVNPEFDSHVSSKDHNRDLLSLIADREFDIDKLLELARKNGNPGGALFSALTGRKGLVTISTEEMAQTFTKANLSKNSRSVRKMRTGGTLQRGGTITEACANVILDATEKAAAPLRKVGIVKSFTNEQREACIATFTGVEHPKKMLEKCVAGEMQIGDMIRSVCARRGLNLNGKDSFSEEVGISHFPDFSPGHSSEHIVATKMATWFEKNYNFTTREQQNFMALATGASLDKTADELLQEVVYGKLPRQEGLASLYDMSGYSRDEMAKEAGIPPRTIMYSTQTNSGARIIADRESILKLAKLIGISEGKRNLFANTFDGNMISRQQAISAYNPEQTHAERITGERKTAKNTGRAAG